MTFHRLSSRTLLISTILLFNLLLQGTDLGTTIVIAGHTPSEPATRLSLGTGHLIVIRLDEDGPVSPAVPPPAAFARTVSVSTADITVNYIGSWTPTAQNAFQYAVDIWETLVSSPVTIVINAEWGPLGSGVLGGARPEDTFANFANAPVAGTWYPVALANSLAGADLAPGAADIRAIFSSSYSNWYFGTDGNPGISKIDFVSVVLHEIGHGLGFSGSMLVDNGSGSWECRGILGEGCWGYNSGFPFTYDRFTENGSNHGLINTVIFANPSTALGGQLTSENVFFDGPNTTVANGGKPAELYAPGSWQRGASYSHLDDETYDGSANALMTHAITAGEANHDPGPVAMAIYKDMGWMVSAVNTAPVISMYNPLLEVNTSQQIDLWQHASDAESPDGELTFNLIDAGNASAGVTLDSGRYLTIDPASDWTGETMVTIEVTDPQGLSDTSSFRVIVVLELQAIYLPAVLSNN